MINDNCINKRFVTRCGYFGVVIGKEALHDHIYKAILTMPVGINEFRDRTLFYLENGHIMGASAIYNIKEFVDE